MVRHLAVFAFTGALSIAAGTAMIVHEQDSGDAASQDGVGGSENGLLSLSMPAPRPETSSMLSIAEVGGAWIAGSALSMKTFQVGQGDTLIDLLVAAGSSANDADGAIDAIERIYDPRRMQIGQVVTAVLRDTADDGPELTSVSIALDETDYVVASRNANGGFFAERLDEPLSDALLAPVPAMTATDADTGLDVRELEMRRGDTLMRLAVRAGATRTDAHLALRAFGDLVAPTAIQIGQTMQVAFAGAGANASLMGISLEIRENTFIVSERLTGGNFHAYRSDAPLSSVETAAVAATGDVATAMADLGASGATTERLTIVHGDTLMDLIVAAGATITEAHEAARVLGRHFDPRGLQIGQQLYVTLVDGPAGSGLKRLGLVVLDAGDNGLILVSRPDGDVGFEGQRISDLDEIATALPPAVATSEVTEATDDEVLAKEGAEADPAAAEQAPIPEFVDFARPISIDELAVEQGDTLMSILLRAGADRIEADRAIRALRPHYDLRHLQIGQEVKVAFEDDNGDGELLVTVSIRIKEDLYVQADLQGDSFMAGRITTPINPVFTGNLARVSPAADIDSLIQQEPDGDPEAVAEEAETVVAAVPDYGDDPAPVSDIESELELSASAEQSWFTIQEDETVPNLLRLLTPNGHEINKIVALLAAEMDLNSMDAGQQMVVITDEDFSGVRIVALSLDRPEGGTWSVVVQRDGGYGIRAASSHVDLSDFNVALAVVEPQRFGPWPEEPSGGIELISVEIPSGGILMNALTGLGIGTVQADEAVDSLRDVFDPRSIQAGQIIDVTMDEDGLLNISLSPRAGERVEVARDEEGFVSRLVELPVERVLRATVGHIDSSLYQAALDGGVPPAVLADMIRAYSFDVDFQREIRSGDSFELLYEAYVGEEGNVVRYGTLLYATLRVSGVSLPIYQFTPSSGFIDYFNERGESVRKALIRTPIDGARITSNFGMRTLSGYTRMHKGVDFGAPTGTPIVAAGDGIIEDLGWFGGYGNYIRIRHNSTYKTAYAHMSAYASGLGEGNRVRQGQVIGYVGSTGNSTGPHLHYEVLVNNEQINPLDVNLPSGEILEGDERDAFYVVRDERDALFAQHLAEPLVASGN
ncbi:MAG: peptidoglycan DD-metalloendopeptidase family protein [Rhodospirillales bacterium]|nr:peptidoglycan DD-metalloendopeptidase family protein [Rhodospirillales bacterium]